MASTTERKSAISPFAAAGVGCATGRSRLELAPSETEDARPGVGALLYYAARVWTYIFFVPNVFEFMDTSRRAVVGEAGGARDAVGESQLGERG